MTRSRRLKTAAFASVALLAGIGGAAGEEAHARLTGFEEVPSILSTGRGTFEATLSASSIVYTLTYQSLAANVTQAHIHFAQKGVNGGISAYLCTNLGNGPAGTPVCPGARTGTVASTIVAAEVVGPAGQNIPAGQLARLLRAMRAGTAYVNVHTVGFPGGEIRGQIKTDD